MNRKDSLFQVKSTLNIRGNLLSLERPLVMGILNVTPDSFFEGSRVENEKSQLQKAERMLAQGASILDVGGYSSRPGAEHISEDEERKRVSQAIGAIAREFPDAPISVDSFRASVAEAAIDSGAAIINDISGGSLDDQMFETVARLKVPYILMHMRGTPQNMVKQTQYEHLIEELFAYFAEKVGQLQPLGVSDIVLDPGFGFAKTKEQSYEVLRNLGYFKSLKLPLLAGLSRKSMIYKELGTSPEEALNGTSVLNTMALMNGASILSVHDVKPAVEAVKLYLATYT